MDPESELHLLHVHPNLVKIVRATLQTPQAFRVVYGIRTVAAEQQAVATGHSTTMHSRHLPNAQGFSCAVDVAAWINDQLSWAKGKELQIFGQIATQIKTAASGLSLPVEWGGDWHTFKDWGHFQLPWKDYP